MKRFRVRTLPRAFFCGVLACGVLVFRVQCPAQTNSLWRFWDTSDGFVESYSSSTVSDAAGNVWVKHGDTRRMDLLDGYSAPQYPDPGGYGKLECAPDGTLWIWSVGGLKRLDGSRWTSFPVPAVTQFGALRSTSQETWEITSRESPFYRATISVVALNRSHVLIMLPDRVLEFDSERSESRPVMTLAQTGLSRFVSMRAARDGAVLLTGRGGLGLLAPSATRDAASGPDVRGGDWHWQLLPRPSATWVEFNEPFEGEGRTLFVTGIASTLTKAALRFDGRRWTELYRGESATLRAWPGKEGSVWIQDGNEVIELTAGRREVADKTGALAGILIGLTPQGPGRFWVSGAQGLALYSPALWQTPPEAPQIDSVVNAISEDRSGNLWFLSEHALVRFDNSKWSSYPLPKGETPWAIFTEGPAVLPDGRLAILTTTPHWLIFDPVRHSFHVLEHPAKRTLRMLIPQPDGTLIAETSPPGSSQGVAFERFDGRAFHPFLGPGKVHAELRNLRLQSNGGIWIGGTSFFSVYRNEEFHRIGAAEGFTDQGAYYIYEDPAGKMLAGGQDGVYQLEGRRWNRLQSGLDRVRNMIRARDGSLWISSGTGVHRYRNGIWVANGREEGLPSSVVYKVFEDSRGRIWAGTTRGLSLFHPEADADPPRALIAEDQNPRESPPGGKTRLVFSGVDRWKFTLPARLLFSYRMDGASWSSFAPATSASWNGLSAGKHHFEVRAMDRNGNISPTSAIHDFTVLLPWYATPGFRWLASGAGTIIVLLLTLASLNYRRRGALIRKLDQKNKLERDRQSILEMVAKREPLPQILQKIAACIVRNRRGATCVVVREHDFALEVFSEPKLPEDVLRSIQRLNSPGPSRAPEDPALSNPLSGEWMRNIRPALRAYCPGTCTVVPVSAGDHEILGAIALSSHHDLLSDSDHWLLETFGGMAAAAIENARLYERLAYQACHDDLTGLPNRVYFDGQLQSAISSAATTGRALAVMYLDLDRFKQINDSLGHTTGDLFLKQVAIRLASVLDTGSTLARVGGDEFTVLFERDVDKTSAGAMASNMLAALRRPIEIDNRELFATASIGISFFPADGETPSTLQKHADIAMYRAKARGKNRIEFFAAEMGSKTEVAMSMEHLLRRALEQGRFELRYQPQLTLERQLVGFEGLLRLNQPGRGLIDPVEFIPIAEETGLIVPIGAWVLRQACRQLKEWRDDGLPRTRIAINVAALQITRDSFADEVAGVLREMRVPPDCLELELTESAIIMNSAESTRQMHKLRALGVRLAIDDFGTGYSSFAHLQTLPLDCVKIDKCFISGFSHSTARSSLIRSMADLGRSLGLTVVAEGVETEEQLSLVRESGCDLVQGYLFSLPQPAAQARAQLVDAEPVAVPAF